MRPYGKEVQLMMVLISSTQFSTLSEACSGMVNSLCEAERLVRHREPSGWIEERVAVCL